MADPRHGLALLGPHDAVSNCSVRYGIIGTPESIKRFKNWLEKVQKPISEEGKERSRPPFPGFEAAFGMGWHLEPLAKIEFTETQLDRVVNLDDVRKRVHETVGFYLSRILTHLKAEETRPDLWIVMVPEVVYQNCRPKSKVAKEFQVRAEGKLSAKAAKAGIASGFLFPEMNEELEAYRYEPDFHHQLKGRLLKHCILTQLVRESTVAPGDFLQTNGRPKRDLTALQSQIAWNLCSSLFYKVAGRPWKLEGVRPGVCYIGLVFKKDGKSPDCDDACCAAQMFLDSGDGVVFKGHNGPWRSPETFQYHLSSKAAEDLLTQAIESYRGIHQVAPREVFIHGRTQLDDNEWEGFLRAAGTETEVVGIRIADASNFRLYRASSKMPVLRGVAWIQDDTHAFLMTRGYVPSLGTYPGHEVPRPLEVQICRGNAAIQQVLADILGLTKLNYNSCTFADGDPVTLKFADAVGEVLLSGPMEDVPPLAFKYYI
jgi:hypothetical protein